MHAIFWFNIFEQDVTATNYLFIVELFTLRNVKK